jgi:hypothetical protein
MSVEDKAAWFDKWIAKQRLGEYPTWGTDQTEALADIIADWRKRGEAAEAMRAKTIDECEAIARQGSFPFDINVWIDATKREMTVHVALAIADAIAALKGNGEGRA